jgi:hypothetical protein
LPFWLMELRDTPSGSVRTSSSNTMHHLGPAALKLVDDLHARDEAFPGGLQLLDLVDLLVHRLDLRVAAGTVALALVVDTGRRSRCGVPDDVPAASATAAAAAMPKFFWRCWRSSSRHGSRLMRGICGLLSRSRAARGHRL